MQKLLLFTTVLSMAAFTAINAKITFTAPLKKTDTKGQITFFEDAEGKKFLLKRHDLPEMAIHETLSAQIGESAGVNINHVEISSVPNPYSGQINAETFHTHSPGIQFYLNGNINDAIADMKDVIDLRKGLIDDVSLKNIALNKSLCEIVALDIFVNNCDRHNGNLFFDKKTNQFHAIDMGHSFANVYMISNSNDEYDPGQIRELFYTFGSHYLSTNACNFLEELDQKNLSSEEIKALKRVDKALGKLMHEYPPAKIYNTWMNLADTIDYTYSPIKKETIKIVTEYNFHETKRVRSQLDRLSRKPVSMRYAFQRMAQPSKKAQHDFWRTMNS